MTTFEPEFEPNPIDPFLEFAARELARPKTAAATVEPEDHLTFLRRLMADEVSLEHAQRKMYQRHFHGRAAAATVEALMFCLRERRTTALKEPKVSRWVRGLSEPQMHEVCARLQ